MNKTLLDNSENLLMVTALKECIADPKIDTIRIATGYWDIPGMALLVQELTEFLQRDNAKLKLLIGKDPYVYAKLLKEPKFKDGMTYPQDFIRTSINDLADNLKDEYKNSIDLLLKFCDSGAIHSYDAPLERKAIASIDEEEHKPKIEIHILEDDESGEKQFLHSKCYIFTASDDDAEPMYAIVGSSNFTEKGLIGNAELNYLDNDPYIINAPLSPKRKGHITWFEEKWAQSKDWTQEFLEQILQPSKPVVIIEEEKKKQQQESTAPLTPYELYIKLLQHKFGHLVDLNLGQLIQSYLPQHYETYTYQIDAVKQCFATMKEHGGFLLSDVVGLGKTIVGMLLIRHYLQIPDEDGREQRVLVITPPAIQSAWKLTLKDFDESSPLQMSPYIDFITTGSIGKLSDDVDDDMADDDTADTGKFTEALQPKNYGLILIDESHKFRNSETAMYKALDALIDNIGAEVGAYPYIGLLSATPQNNRPSDLQNQIYLFERNHAESTLKRAMGGNLEGFFADVNRRYSAIIHEKVDMSLEERNLELKELSKEIRDCVLCDIMVRRTRTDVNLYYQKDKDKQGLTFPLIEGPISLQYKMSHSLAHLFYDTMGSIAPDAASPNGLMYYRYRAIQYLVDPEEKKKYDARGSRNADALAEQLAKIMQMNLVKRLESSFTAFKQSLLNLRQYTQNMIDMWEHDDIFICPSFNVNAELDRAKKEERRKHKVTLQDCFEDIRKHIAKLEAEGKNEDKSNCEYHCSDFDPNYIDLLRTDLSIISELCDRWSKNSEDPKFDEFKENLRFTLFNPQTNRPQKLVVFTEAIDTAESIAHAAEAKGYRVLLISAANRTLMEPVIRENFDANYKGEWKNDYDLIVTTDVLAEGINLHRANCILNYDTPWNSTRLMQRIGRVNRIGSHEEKVYVYNFMPSAEGDAEISLVQKAHVKLQSFHTLFGEDSQIFSQAEEVEHYDLNRQVNGEESPLEKYIYELKQYKEIHPERYAFIEQIKDGLALATTTHDGTGYFLVRTPRMSGMFVRFNPMEEEGAIISLSDGLEAFRTDLIAEATALPVSWEDMCEEAERVVTAELNSVRFMRSNSQKATDAKGAIIKLKKTQEMSARSKKLLNDADKIIRQGNGDMVKRILKLAKEIEDKLQLFPLTAEEFDTYLDQGIAKFVANAIEKHGKPQVFLGTYK